MTKEILNDIIEWDVVNWSQAIAYWNKNVDIKNKHFTCLELGGRKGGLSLWLAMNGNDVICSDLESPEKFASILHHQHSYDEKIESTSFSFK